jgi:DNA polymerase-3 subunit gamma/tau
MNGTNFELNDEEFNKIKEISQNVKNEILILFWQFCIKSLSELEIVSNQHLSVEMFLIRLVHLKNIKNEDSESIISENTVETNTKSKSIQKKNEKDDLFDLKEKVSSIGQMKNIVQEKNIEEKKNEDIDNKKNIINSFEQLIEFCSLKKEMKLKYELEKNVNLVSFEKQRIEISFNENLDKDFIKNLSSKLYDWTDLRWIITLSKIKGKPSKREKDIGLKNDLIVKLKESSIYKDVLSKFKDAELIDVKNIEKEKLND